MTNRTLQFWGAGYAIGGTELITIDSQLNGNLIYTGTIPTNYTGPVSVQPEDQVLLFTCTSIPVEYAGTIPMSVTLDNPMGVSAYFEQVYSNYMTKPNPVYTSPQWAFLQNPTTTQTQKVYLWEDKAVPPLSQEEISILNTTDPADAPERDAILIQHNITTNVSSGPDEFLSVVTPATAYGDPRTNVIINGVSCPRGTSPATGTWGYLIDFPSENTGSMTCDLTIEAGLLL